MSSDVLEDQASQLVASSPRILILRLSDGTFNGANPTIFVTSHVFNPWGTFLSRGKLGLAGEAAMV
jgi:hypothetical protein